MRLFSELERSILKPGQNAILPALLILGGTCLMLPFGMLHAYGCVPWFLTGAGLMVTGYFWSLREKSIPVWIFWGVTVGVRFLLLWQVPGDDIFRYIWEGRILLAGFNPYLHSPDASVLESLRGGVWDAVQYKSFTAIYPPLAEWLFAGFSGILPVPLFFKSVFAAADLCTVFLLVRAFGKPAALLYAWNPLVIYSFAGGGHFDGIFVLALVCGWLAWRKEKILSAALWIGGAIAIKWIALPLLAWMLWTTLWQRGWKSALPSAFSAVLPFLVSWSAVGIWTGEWTTQLLPPMFSEYARSAEFLPAIVGWFWDESRYENHLFILPLAIVWTIVIVRARSFEIAAQWIFFFALVLTPMLHGWYFTWIIPFAVLTRNRGIIVLAASGFTYFLLYHHVESPGGIWRLSPVETAVLWLPFVAGFLWSEWRRLFPVSRRDIPR